MGFGITQAPAGVPVAGPVPGGAAFILAGLAGPLAALPLLRAAMSERPAPRSAGAGRATMVLFVFFMLIAPSSGAVRASACRPGRR